MDRIELKKENKELTKRVKRLQNIVDGLSRRKRDYEIGQSKSDTLRFAVISDTHIGNLYERIDALHEFYKLLKKEKIDTVFHCGDVIDGHKIYRGQEYEQYAVGFDKQLEAIVKRFPKGIDTYFISGNHDASYKNLGGFNVGKIIDKYVDNLHFLDQDIATVRLKTKSGKLVKYRLMHPSGGCAYAVCLSEDTEILTEDGFKLFKDLNNERIATLNPKTHKFEWQHYTDFIEQEFDGELLHFLARSFDFLVTPNHRLFLRRYPNNLIQNRKKRLIFPLKSHKRVSFKWVFKEAKDLIDCKRQEWQLIKNSEDWGGELIEEIEVPYLKSRKYGHSMKHIGKMCIEDVAEIIAWYVTEGHIGKNKKCLELSQSPKANPINHKQIIDLMKRTGLNVKGKSIKICSRELCEWLIKECGSGSRNKFLPKWLKNQPKNILEIVFETMINGDGWITNTGFGYRSISKRLLDDFCEISLKLGYGVTFYNDSLSISKEQVRPTINRKPKKVKYKGKVYCVSVPNQIIMIRRNGKTIWTGNSYKSQKIVESIAGGDKPRALFIGHYHKADLLPMWRNVASLQVGCFCSQTPYMARKPTPAHVGGFIIEDTIGKKTSRFKTEFVAFYEPQDYKEI